MDLNKSIELALQFIESKQAVNGSWQDFNTLAGYSDEWVTGYVGFTLAEMDDKKAKVLAVKAWKFLSHRKFLRKGWGYNKWTPSDADSTIWAIKLASTLGIRVSYKLSNAYSFLMKHQKPNGAVSTYKQDSHIRHFTKLSKEISFRGWCNTHHCVTAALGTVKNFPKRARIVDYLICKQFPEGYWLGYWWCDIEYATALAVEALSIEDGYESGASVYHSVEWAKKQIKNKFDDFLIDECSPFSVSLLLLILCFTRNSQTVNKELNIILPWLIETQYDDGSWTGSARLRIPPPDCLDPEDHAKWRINGKGSGSIINDQNRIFTTATVLRSLNLAKTKFPSLV